MQSLPAGSFATRFTKRFLERSGISFMAISLVSKLYKLTPTGGRVVSIQIPLDILLAGVIIWMPASLGCRWSARLAKATTDPTSFTFLATTGALISSETWIIGCWEFVRCHSSQRLRSTVYSMAMTWRGRTTIPGISEAVAMRIVGYHMAAMGVLGLVEESQLLNCIPS